MCDRWLLRPFGFDTLATHLCQFAKDELLKQAAMPALLIVLAGTGPSDLDERGAAALGRGKGREEVSGRPLKELQTSR